MLSEIKSETHVIRADATRDQGYHTLLIVRIREWRSRKSSPRALPHRKFFRNWPLTGRATRMNSPRSYPERDGEREKGRKGDALKVNLSEKRSLVSLRRGVAAGAYRARSQERTNDTAAVGSLPAHQHWRVIPSGNRPFSAWCFLSIN